MPMLTIRNDLTAEELRRLARRERNAAGLVKGALAALINIGTTTKRKPRRQQVLAGLELYLDF